MSSATMTPAEIDAILLKVAKDNESRKRAQQKYKAKANVKELNAKYMVEYRKKKKAEYNAMLEALEKLNTSPDSN
jgi:hypothetical protein